MVQFRYDGNGNQYTDYETGKTEGPDGRLHDNNKIPDHKVRGETERWNNRQTESNNSGGCFITTACTQLYNLPDDCYELETIRKLRDDFMLKSKTGQKNVELYYKIAPIIVNAINQSPDKKNELQYLYNNCIKPTIKLIEEKEFSKAEAHYEHHIKELAHKYNILD